MYEHSWGEVVRVFAFTFVFFWLWDKIDGASRWERKQREIHRQALKEGWRKWASTPEN
jgi:hypothetical protein